MTNKPESEVKTFKEFLESTPPGKDVKVSDLMIRPKHIGISAVTKRPILCKPELNLYCREECKGDRFFASITPEIQINISGISNVYIVYICQNCKKGIKTFSIRVMIDATASRRGEVFKYGELPPFGPPTPPKALTLIGTDRDLFLTGRRAENQGMGIGAFTYYRRVVENQKDKIFDAVIKVTNKISPGDPIIEELKQAKKETQFTKAVGEIKHGLPSSLQINGQNPLTLLHSALSEGVHDRDDEKCLELAGDIRNVLFAFADKLAYALKEDTELNASVSRLIKAKEEKRKKGK